MTKPDDIDQDAWDTGARMAGEYLSWLHAGNSAGHLSEHAVSAMADTIARAIMSARAEEREACVRIVLDYPPEGFNEALYERTERHDELDPFWEFKGDTGYWAVFMGEVLKPYAAAIRNRP